MTEKAWQWEKELKQSQEGLIAWADALGVPVERLREEYARELVVVQLLHGRDGEAEKTMFIGLTKKWNQEYGR